MWSWGSFDLKVKNQKIGVNSVFMGVSFPSLGHGLFLKWTRLQRLFSKLPIHFLLCIGFKLGWFFPLVCLGIFYKMPRHFPKLFNSFYKLPKLAHNRMLKLFPKLFKLLRHVLYPQHPRVPRVYPRLLRIFHKLHGFFGTLVAHAFS
jgi:hypothetical protein